MAPHSPLHMQIRNTETGFGHVAQLLHWAIAILVACQFILARMAAGASLFEQLGLLAWHKSFGMTIFGLAALRLMWRLSNPRPSTPRHQPRYQRLIARASHDLMYLLIFALPLTGWIMSSAVNTPVSYFGLFTWPDLIAPRQEFAELLKLVHGTLFKALAAIVCVHVAAALYHHFIAGDDVLRRMLPGPGNRTT